jgi:hypothetical protein
LAILSWNGADYILEKIAKISAVLLFCIVVIVVEKITVTVAVW